MLAGWAGAENCVATVYYLLGDISLIKSLIYQTANKCVNKKII